MKKAIIDVTTGETIIVDYTQEEIDEINAQWYSKDNLKKIAADVRWQKEIGGCAWNGYTVATDRDSQNKLIAEFIAVNAGLRTDPSGWKMADGQFVSLTNAEMISVIITARTHIAACFAAEKEILDAIEAGTVTNDTDIINWPTWPSS